MKVRMKVYISGTRDNEQWPPVGGEIDLNEKEARALIAGGVAELVKEAKQAEQIEAAVIEPPENAARRPGRPRKSL